MTDREKALEEAAEGLVHMLQKLEARSDVSSDWRVSIRAALVEYKRALALPASASEPSGEPEETCPVHGAACPHREDAPPAQTSVEGEEGSDEL